jgi:hypothetical protein
MLLGGFIVKFSRFGMMLDICIAAGFGRRGFYGLGLCGGRFCQRGFALKGGHAMSPMLISYEEGRRKALRLPLL